MRRMEDDFGRMVVVGDVPVTGEMKGIMSPIGGMCRIRRSDGG